MAQTSMTVSAANIFKYIAKPSGLGRAAALSPIDIENGYLISSNYSGNVDINALCIKYPDLRSTLGHHVLYRVEPVIRISTYDDDARQYVQAQTLASEPTVPESTSDISAPRLVSTGERPRTTFFFDPVTPPGQDYTLTDQLSSTDDVLSLFASQALNSRALVFMPAPRNQASPLFGLWTTLLNGDDPSLAIYYDDSVMVTTRIASTSGLSGYKNPRNAITLSWKLDYSAAETYRCADENFKTASGTFYWKVSGAESYNSLSLTANQNSLTIPANTFPTESTILWYLDLTDSAGNHLIGSEHVFSTTDGTATATPLSPINSVENGGNPITLSWEVSNTTGEAPSRIVVEWARSTAQSATWYELLDVSEAVYSCEAPADTFPGGNIYWRVTAYNADSVAGPTSTPVLFQCIAPPAAPESVAGDGAPFTTISWQAETQTAFEISVDGIVVVRKFGTGIYSYMLKEPLEDGEHEVVIRVQGDYGYWSNPTAATISVLNAGSGSITLNGNFNVDADLYWICSSSEENIIFRVYRDGKMIAKTKGLEFLDRFVLGEHVYHVLAELSGGNYIRSGEISGTLRSCVTRIAPTAGGEWMELLLSEKSDSVQTFTWNRSITLRHYAGAAYPVAEMSPYEDRIAAYDCAFKTVQEAKAFEALRGQIVILKSRGGEVVIGVLNQLNKVAGDFYIAFTFSIQQIHWEDMIDDTNS